MSAGAAPRKGSFTKDAAGVPRYLQRNKRVAAAVPPSAPTTNAAAQAGRRSFPRDRSGVPFYLQKFKQEEEERKQKAEETSRVPKLPDGQRLLSEDERLAILEGLRAKKAELDQLHARLPMRSDTQCKRQRASELEQTLREVERGIERFSKPRVLVKP